MKAKTKPIPFLRSASSSVKISSRLPLSVLFSSLVGFYGPKFRAESMDCTKNFTCIFDVSSILNNVPSKASWPNDNCFGMVLLQSQRLAHMLLPAYSFTLEETDKNPELCGEEKNRTAPT